MGWWRIDPETCKPLKGARSKLSPPGVDLLNAVPGADDEPRAYYCGDFPRDVWAAGAGEVAAFVRRHRLGRPSLDELLAFVLDRVVPPSFAPAGNRPVEELLRRVARGWADIDNVYREEWGCPARREERIAACREYLKPLAGRRRRRRDPAGGEE